MTTGRLTCDPQHTARKCSVSPYDAWPVAQEQVETAYEMLYKMICSRVLGLKDGLSSHHLSLYQPYTQEHTPNLIQGTADSHNQIAFSSMPVVYGYTPKSIVGDISIQPYR